MVGEAQARISQVPEQVFCVRLRVEGSRTVEKSFDVTPGQSSLLALNGLPVGLVTFKGSAFSASCAMTPPIPTWISDPTPAFLTAGTVVDVSLSLKRNGGANVDVDFETLDGGTPPPFDIAMPPPFDLGPPADLATPPPAALAISPGGHHYPAPSSFTFTVRNNGGGGSGPISASLFGDSRFVIQGNTCMALTPGATCTITVRSNIAPQGIGGEAELQVSATPGGSTSAFVSGGILP